jgi:hypothetical protein
VILEGWSGVILFVGSDPVWFSIVSESKISWREATLDTCAGVIQREQAAHKLAISLTTRHLDSNLLRALGRAFHSLKADPEIASF